MRDGMRDKMSLVVAGCKEERLRSRKVCRPTEFGLRKKMHG